jgi:hypothetical protein
MTDRYVLIGQTPVPEDDLMAWASWYEDADNRQARIVKQEMVGNVFLSTVFLGLDHSFRPGGDPELFETMAFWQDANSDLLCYRCSTWSDAEAQHERAAIEVADTGFQLLAMWSAAKDWWRKFKHYMYWIFKPNHLGYGGGPCIACWEIRKEHKEFFK